MIYIGVDPGLKGGVATISDDGFYAPLPDPARIYETATGEVAICPLQTMKLKGKNQCDYMWFSKLIEAMLGGGEAAFAMVEHQHARIIMIGGKKRVDTPTTSLSLGMSYMMPLAVFGTLGISHDCVEPAKWKKGLGVSGDKNAMISFCRRLYPTVTLIPPRGRVYHDGMAEALLIAEYGRRIHGGAAEAAEEIL